ncbi:MAG: response regulator transcription factor [Desulfobacterales bacterium]|nr:response regulator transcription factor [Desulfobacterales bacterium]
MRILVVEDNQDIAENIGDYFEAKGHSLDFAMDGIGGLHLALTEDYDVMILDIMLPGMDGLSLCKKLRESSARKMPVLMLTARDTLPDKISGFESGTDDYLVKPFALQELEVRIYSLVKRTKTTYTSVLTVSDLEFNIETMTVTRAGQQVELNRACLQILEMLMSASPKVVSRKELDYALWGDMPPGSDALRSHLYTLRRKIDKPFPRHLLQTVHGVGYKLVDIDEIHT